MSKSDPNQLTLLEYLRTEAVLPSAAPPSLREREVWLEQETKARQANVHEIAADAFMEA